MLRSQTLSGHTVRRLPAPHAVLLALVAAGMLWGNVLLFRFLDFPVTLEILMTVGLFIYGIGNWIRPAYRPNSLLLPALALLLYEFAIHGVLGGATSDLQWPRSFSLFAMCTGLLLVSSRFRIGEYQLPSLAKWVGITTYLMGGLGIIQFIAANLFGYIWNPLPEGLTLGGSDSVIDVTRFAGLYRSLGISSEYSYYGIGMVVLTTLCLTLLSLVPPDRRSSFFRNGALLVGIGGILTSASFAAWGVFVVVLLVYIGANPSRVLRYKKTFITILLLAIAGFVIVWPFLQGRLLNVIESEDSSFNYRIRVAIDLIIAPADDLPSALLGTGVGMDNNNPMVNKTLQKYFSVDYLNWILGNRTRLVIVSAWAYIVVTMGWVGFVLNGWLLAAVFRGQGRQSIPVLPLVALTVGYLFAIGSYLSPEWWALLVLISALKRVRIP